MTLGYSRARRSVNRDGWRVKDYSCLSLVYVENHHGGSGDKNNHFSPRSPDFVQTDGMSRAVEVPLVEQLYGQSVALRQLHGPSTASSNHFIHGCQQFRHFEVSANGLGDLKDGLGVVLSHVAAKPV
jgi:hypothetical protein